MHSVVNVYYAYIVLKINRNVHLITSYTYNIYLLKFKTYKIVPTYNDKL